MIKALISKQIAETFSIGFDFSDLLADSDTISSCAVAAVDQKFGVSYSTGSSKVIGSTTATLDGTSTIASVKVLAGIAGYRYIITFTATTLNGDVLTGEVILRVY